MKKFYFATALAAFALASCTSDDIGFNTAQDVIEAQQSNAIQFGTYMGNTPVTRAGKAGSLTTEGLKAPEAGFGVFAYYTNTSDYTYSAVTTTGATGQTTLKPNFMYNQKVTWSSTRSSDGSYITNWEYTPVKYWPNNLSNTDVDDQNNDTNSDPAKASENGGKVTFFAYAPYVDHTAPYGTDGITAITDNSAASDPILTYVVPATGNPVDLLWGTYGNTSKNVNATANTGVAYNASGSDYAKSILPHWTDAGHTNSDGYRVNADLTKQKTNGKVDFAFKHALAKVGGSQDYSSSGITMPHGLQVILDVDDEKGAEKGGSFNNAETKVTVTSVNIVAKSFVDANNDKVGNDGEYLTEQKGNFNLANGNWNITGTKGNASAAATSTHLINRDGSGAQGTLNPAIAEPASLADGAAAWNGLVNGVLTSAQNVYDSEAAPLVFIPGTNPELTITVVYTVRTKDANLEKGYSQVVQTITKKVTFKNPVELNKQYSLLMHLGLTSVKFTAYVSDWQLAGDTNGNGEIDGTEKVDVADVFVPINVAAYSVKMEGAKASGSVAATGENYTTSAGKVHWYDYENSTWQEEAGSGTYTMASSSAGVSISGTSPAFTVTFAPNTGTRNRKMTVTASYTGSDFEVSKQPEAEVFEYTQAPQDLQITNPSALTATALAAAAASVNLTVQDASSTNLDLTNASNISVVTVPSGWSYVKTNTGITVTVPKGTLAGTYTVKVKVNDTNVKDVTFTVS